MNVNTGPIFYQDGFPYQYMEKDGECKLYKLIRINSDEIRIRIIDDKTESKRQKHCVYLLRSLNPRYSRRTYIGYTVNPERRIRQHNGEITGGAKRTIRARPWKMVCYIEGFPDQRTGLQYEWINNHPSTKRWNVSGRLKTGT